MITIAIRVARGHVDPGFFYYPSFFFYLVAAATLVATPALWLFKHADPLTIRAFVIDPGPYFLIGRLVSVAFGVAAVYFVYRIGRAAFGRPAGLIAGLLLAVAPLAVTYSHVAVTDMAATALALLTIGCCSRRRRAADAAGWSVAPSRPASPPRPSTTSARSYCRRPWRRCTRAARR